MAIAWSTAMLARTLGAPASEAAEAVTAPPATVPPPTTAAPPTTTTAAPVPTMPEDGLVVLRYTPVEKPQPEIRRVVVTRPGSGSTATASAGAAAPPPPTTTTSSGS
jgi:hypothetical protein